MKKLIMIILTTLLVLLLVGCGGTNNAADSDVTDNDFDTKQEASTADADKDAVDNEDQIKEAEQPGEMVAGTNVSVYPNAELAYSSEDEIVYITTDSAETVNDFYKNHANLKEFRSSKTEWYAYSTPLTDLLGDMGLDTDLWADEERIAEINAYIKESGGLQGLTIYDANMDEDFKEMSLAHIYSEVPHDKTIIIYSLLEEM